MHIHVIYTHTHTYMSICIYISIWREKEERRMKLSVVKCYVWGSWMKRVSFDYWCKFSVSLKECQNKRLKTKNLTGCCSCAPSWVQLRSPSCSPACLCPDQLFPPNLLLSGLPVSFHFWEDLWSLQDSGPATLGWALTLTSLCSRGYGSTVLIPRSHRQAGKQEWWIFFVQPERLQKCKRKGARFSVFRVQRVVVWNQNALLFIQRNKRLAWHHIIS